MRFKTKKIIDVAHDLIQKNEIKEDVVYQWIDIVGIPQRPKDLESSLFFGSYSDGLDGWHNAFDRRTVLQNVILEQGWHVVTEDNLSLQGPHLVVTSLMELTERLYSWSRSNSQPFIIGVTGSVGKTTTVAFLEHLLRTSGYRVTRFWSNRLTPLLIQTHYINRVDVNTDFVVLEYSAYLHDHVEALSSILPPHISFFTNLYAQHIRQDLFKDKMDIFGSKVRIRPSSGIGFINSLVLNDLNIATPSGWNEFSVERDIPSSNPLLPPTYRTAEIYSVGKIISQHLALPAASLEHAFSTFVPQENRIPTYRLAGGSLFFDSEAPHGCRLLSWFETIDGSTPSLFVDSIDFGNDDVKTYLDLLKMIFGSERTYVLDTKQNRDALPVEAQYVDRLRFGEELVRSLNAGNYVVYHKTIKGRINGFDPKAYLDEQWGRVF